jgi:hypothetical protein
MPINERNDEFILPNYGQVFVRPILKPDETYYCTINGNPCIGPIPMYEIPYTNARLFTSKSHPSGLTLIYKDSIFDFKNPFIDSKNGMMYSGGTCCKIRKPKL